MTDDDFFNIKLETPPPELELSVEMRCREVMKSNNFDEEKKKDKTKKTLRYRLQTMLSVFR